MSQDTFLNAFEQIDRDRDGVITIEDLENYARNDAVSPDFVSKWKTLFDPQNTGKITFEHFCTTLGVSKKARDNAIRRRRPDPTIYDCNLTPQTKTDALDVIREKYDHENPDSCAHVTLVELDGKLGPRWQMKTVKDLEKPKARGEYMIYSLDNGKHKYLIWREQEKRACCSCCFC